MDNAFSGAVDSTYPDKIENTSTTRDIYTNDKLIDDNQRLREKILELESKNQNLVFNNKNINDELEKKSEEIKSLNIKLSEANNIRKEVNDSINSSIENSFHQCFERQFNSFHNNHNKIYIISSKQAKLFFNAIVWVITILGLISIALAAVQVLHFLKGR